MNTLVVIFKKINRIRFYDRMCLKVSKVGVTNHECFNLNLKITNEK